MGFLVFLQSELGRVYANYGRGMQSELGPQGGWEVVI